MDGVDLIRDHARIYREYGEKVLGFSYRMLRDQEDAEDATQETFLRAFKGARAFEGRSGIGTWLLSIARNVCVDALRGRKRSSFAALEGIIDEAIDRRTSEGGAALEREGFVGSVRVGCLLGTLAALSADQRAAFVLRTLLGLSVSDTAIALGKTENSVRILVHRATRSLKDFLCRNCSIYEPAARCRCENLVGFSIERGWIDASDFDLSPSSGLDLAERVAAEIEGMRRMAALFASLPEPKGGTALGARIRAALGRIEGVELSASPGNESASPASKE